MNDKQLQIVSYEHEEWRNIIGYEDMYQISNLGRVKSLKRKIYCERPIKPLRNGYYLSKEIVLKPRIIDGYNKVSLRKNGISKSHFIHD